MIAADFSNNRFSSRTAARKMVPVQKKPRRVRTERESRIHGEGSQKTSDNLGRLTVSSPKRKLSLYGPKAGRCPRATLKSRLPALDRRPCSPQHVSLQAQTQQVPRILQKGTRLHWSLLLPRVHATNTAKNPLVTHKCRCKHT